MQNHYHLMVTTPDRNLPEAMAHFNRETSREIQRRSNRINQVYGARYFRSLITKNHYFLNSYKYIYRNPVTAKICERVEDYPFSTLHGLLGLSQLVVPVEQDWTLFNNLRGTLEWLNRTPLPDHDYQMGQALKHLVFQLPKSKQKLSSLETELF